MVLEGYVSRETFRMDYLGLIERQAGLWGLSLGLGERERLLRYARLLASYEAANVIGTKNLDDIVLHHVLDSLSCFLFRPLGDAHELADMGSGGGLPGIPVKISKPDLRVTLIESTGKKSRFLRYAADALALEGVTVANARVEELAQGELHRAAYDVVTSRAVARLAVLAEYCVPLLRVGGSAIAMKGRLEPAELSEGEKAAGVVGAQVSEVIRVPLLPEFGDRERRLVVLEKVRLTPPRYPRKPGAAAKRPLGSD